jgi:hypothetical protein
LSDDSKTETTRLPSSPMSPCTEDDIDDDDDDDDEDNDVEDDDDSSTLLLSLGKTSQCLIKLVKPYSLSTGVNVCLSFLVFERAGWPEG